MTEHLVRVVRQFRTAPGITEQLAADFMLPMPTMGAYLGLAHIARPLRVVSVILRPWTDVGLATAHPPYVEAFTEYEAAASLEDAKAHGWELMPGLPRPPEANRGI